MSRVSALSLDTLGDFPLPQLPEETDKNARGRVLVVGGGAWGPGAVLLTALACLRAGAGKVQVAATAPFAPALAMSIPEAAIVTVPAAPDGELSPEAAQVLAANAERADAIVVGPGIMDEAVGADLACALAAAPGEAGFLLDAGAVTGLDRSRPGLGRAGEVVVTPHAGEMAALLGCRKERVEADPLAAAREAARDLKAVVVMKGGQTFVVSPDGRAWLHQDGVVGLATSGSGDVLAGVVGGLLARGAPPLTAAAWGVCVHAAAGVRLSQRMGAVGFLARELLPEVPMLLNAASPSVRRKP